MLRAKQKASQVYRVIKFATVSLAALQNNVDLGRDLNHKDFVQYDLLCDRPRTNLLLNLDSSFSFVTEG